VARHSDDHAPSRRLASLTGNAAVLSREPEELRPTGAFDPGRPGLKVLAALAAVVVVGAGAYAWFARPQPIHVAPAAGTASAVAASEEPATGGVLIVAVAGRVKAPGLVRVKAGARVADAIDAAGGVLPGTDLSTVNLARKVVDGELITIGTAAGSANPGQPGKVNLNTATAAQLDALPGVGPVLAERILAYRESKGGFRSVGELRQVEGIGDAKYDEIKDLVVV
jgi:competence protein ComEA